jgi:hypothetical protein
VRSWTGWSRACWADGLHGARTLRSRGDPIELGRVQAADGEGVSGSNCTLGDGAAVFGGPTAARGRGSADEWNCPRPRLWERRSDAPPGGARTPGGRRGSLDDRDRGSPTTRVPPPGRTTRSLHRWRCDRGSRDRRALRCARGSRLLSPGTPRPPGCIPARAAEALAFGESSAASGVQCRRTARVPCPRRCRRRAPRRARWAIRDHRSSNLSSRQAQWIRARAAFLVCHAEAPMIHRRCDPGPRTGQVTGQLGTSIDAARSRRSARLGTRPAGPRRSVPRAEWAASGTPGARSRRTRTAGSSWRRARSAPAGRSAPR